MNEPLSEDEFAEVLVRRHENGAPVVRLSQNLVVSDAGRQLGHVDDVMTVLA